MNMNELHHDITEIVGRAIFYKDELAKGIEGTKINSDDWLKKYQGRTDVTATDFLKNMNSNIFRNEIDYTVNSIMLTIEKHT